MPIVPLGATIYEEDNLKISVFDLEVIDDAMKEILDSCVCAVCAGAQEDDIGQIKTRLRNRFDDWADVTKMGAIAEFFIHIYMMLNGYKQEFLFLNLEEGSIKKGFDGLYTQNDSHWIMESKSGSISTDGITHLKKVKEAVADLKNKITRAVPNNPWRNAYNHASHCDVGGAKKLRDNLKKMADDFENENYQDIGEMNIVPCATIFLDGNWESFNRAEIIDSIKDIDDLLGKNIHAICVTQKSYDLFLEYIGD